MAFTGPGGRNMDSVIGVVIEPHFAPPKTTWEPVGGPDGDCARACVMPCV